MKKAIVGLAAVGGIIALRPAAGRISQKMREHCQRMASQCKQMMATQPGDLGERAGMPEHGKEMMAGHTGQGEMANTPEHAEQESAQLVGSGEAVAV
jgi:hypothetical protein